MIEDYISKYSEEQDDVLSWLEKQTNLRTNHARMLCGNIEGKLLEFITSMIGAKNILEIGTFTGYSTICLARGTSNDGIIDAIEINDELEDLIREGYARAGVEKKINLIFGNAIEIIPKLNKEYDLVFIDANKREYCDYYNAIINKVRLGGYIIADNVLWSGKVENNKLENAKDPQTQGILLFNQMVKNDKRVENIILPLRDGINIIKKINHNNIKQASDNYYIRRAVKSDIPIIQSIANISFRATYKDILSKEQLEWMLNWMYSNESLIFQMEHDHTFFILYYNNVPSGYISIERQEKSLFHIQKIYLLPEVQKKGLGKALIQHGIDFISSFKIKHCKIELNVNRNNGAVGFYEKMGFKIDRSGDFDIGNGYYMNDYIMIKELHL